MYSQQHGSQMSSASFLNTEKLRDPDWKGHGVTSWSAHHVVESDLVRVLGSLVRQQAGGVMHGDSACLRCCALGVSAQSAGVIFCLFACLLLLVALVM